MLTLYGKDSAPGGYQEPTPGLFQNPLTGKSSQRGTDPIPIIGIFYTYFAFIPFSRELTKNSSYDQYVE